MWMSRVFRHEWAIVEPHESCNMTRLQPERLAYQMQCLSRMIAAKWDSVDNIVITNYHRCNFIALVLSVIYHAYAYFLPTLQLDMIFNGHCVNFFVFIHIPFEVPGFLC